MNETLEETLKSINISFLFAKQLDHGITDGEREWRLFEPTKFIYSFFTFNMLYEIDWKETLSRDRIWNAERKEYTSNKIVELLEFIYLESNQPDFRKYYSGYDNEFSLLKHSKNIRADKNINRIDTSIFSEEKLSYLQNYRHAVRKIPGNDFSLIDHYKLIIFTYQIRNNIFHGQKKAMTMIETGQRERLLDYSYIILTTIEMFFEIMKGKKDYYPATEAELWENAFFSPSNY